MVAWLADNGWVTWITEPVGLDRSGEWVGLDRTGEWADITHGVDGKDGWVKELIWTGELTDIDWVTGVSRLEGADGVNDKDGWVIENERIWVGEVDGLDSWVTDNLIGTGGSTCITELATNDGYTEGVWAAMEVDSWSDDNTDCHEGELIKSNSSLVVSNSFIRVGVKHLFMFASATWVC